MPVTGPNLGITISETAGASAWDVWMNLTLGLLDAIICLDVINRSENTPPGSPANGDRYIVGGSPTGAFSGQAGKIAVRRNSAWTFYTPKEGWLLTSQADPGKLYKYQGSAFVLAGDGTGSEESFIIPASDESTALTAGTNKMRVPIPFGMTITDIQATLNDAQGSGSVLTVDVNKNGTSILSTKLTFDNSETKTTTAATPRVISDTSLAAWDIIGIDIDQVGSPGATGLKVVILGTRTS